MKASIEVAESGIPVPFSDTPSGDRRRCPRNNLYYPATLVAGEGEGAVGGIVGVTVNVSSGGVLLVCGDRGLRPGVRVGGYIRALSAQGDDGTIGFTARVVRVGEFLVNGAAADEMVGVAVEFDSPQDRLGVAPSRHPAVWAGYLRPARGASGRHPFEGVWTRGEDRRVRALTAAAQREEGEPR